jgi:YHS domain-containing protein
MTNIQYLENGKALKGYDAISVYNGAGVPGENAINSVYLEGVYQFASEANKETFDANPEKYAPKYGGHCSIAVSEGALVEANPLSSLVQDGELHVFYKDKDEDTQDEWNEKPIALKKQAESQWVLLTNK